MALILDKLPPNRDASYRPGVFFPQWRDLGVNEEDENWINQLFSWCDGHPHGSIYALYLRQAVLLRLVYDLRPDLQPIIKPAGSAPLWEVFAARAGQNYQFIGYGAHYLQFMADTAWEVFRTGELPFEVMGWDCEGDQGPPFLIIPPQKPGEKVTPDQAKAVQDLWDRVSQIDPAIYAEDRADEIAKAKADQDAGLIPTSQGPELAVEAQKAIEDYERAADEGEAEILELEAARDLVRAEYDEAARDFIAAGGRKEQLSGSFSKSWKRIRKNVKRVIKDVITPAIRIRNEISHSILPKFVREIGRDIDQETRRLGRRIDDNLMRAVKETAQIAPFLRVLMPILGYIPVVGWLALLIVAPTLAIVEITWAAKQKRELDKRIDRAKAALYAEIAAMEEQTLHLRDRTAALKAQREQLAELARAEELRRMVFAKGFIEQQQKNDMTALAIASAATVGTLFVSRNKLYALAPLAAYAGWAYYQKKRGPMAPFWECIALEGGEAECREVWLERQLGTRPDWETIELNEVVDV